MDAPLRRSHRSRAAGLSTCTQADEPAQTDRLLRRAGSHCADSSVEPPSRSLGRASPLDATRTARNQHTLPSPNNDAWRPGGLLNDAESDAPTPSSASAILSAPSTMSRSGHSASLHALTPLTSSDSSPPGKLPSPRSAKPTHSASARSAPLGTPNNAAATITPVNTPPDTRISVFPSDGVLGQRLTYDPLLDSKLDKKARQSRTPKYTAILDKVCDGYT